jgi:Bacterial Ig-like domain (group 3)/Beta-propeller repeat/Planctomycete extracellular
MGLLSWLRNSISSDHSRRFHRNRPTRKPAARCRLTLETLEDRTMPSTLTGLGFSTYLGNGLGENANAVAVDSAGNTYATGNILQSAPSTGTHDHAFVAAFHPDGSLIYSTVLAGSSDDYGLGIAVDSAGNAYVAGATRSADFLTKNAFQSTYGGGTRDAFLTKLDPTGAVLYSTFLGGSGTEVVLPTIPHAMGVAVDDGGHAYVTSNTASTNFPTTANAVQPVYTSGSSFVTELDTNASGAASLVYSTYLQRSGTQGIAIDGSGNAYVTGVALTGFKTTPGAFMTSGSGFVTKLNADGSAVVYSTYINAENAWAIAVDGAGNAAVTGAIFGATAETLPTTAGAYQSAQGVSGDAFVTELNADGSGLVYSTFFGNSVQDAGYGIALDSVGHIFITGFTGYTTSSNASDFPTKNATQPLPGGTDAFVAEFEPTQSGEASLVYSSFLGGSDVEIGYGIAVDASGNISVAGKTQSSDFPTANAFQPNLSGSQAAFVTKIIAPPARIGTTVSLTTSANPTAAGQGLTLTAVVTSAVAGTGTPTGTVTFYSGPNATVLGSAAIDSTGVATFTFTPVAGTDYLRAVYSGSDVFGERNSSRLTEVVTGNQADTIALKSSTSSSVYSQSVTFTATVKAISGSVVPTGTVAFMDGNTVLGTASLTSSGVATYSTLSLSVGSHTITAVYAGDTTFATNTSAAVSQKVKQASTKTTLVSSHASSPFGQPVTFTATVNPVAPGSGTPTGTVTFMDGSTVLGTVTLINGKATFTTSTLTKGKHSITANYTGDIDFLASPLASLTETIA